MSRRRIISEKKILSDPKYKSEILSKFINLIMIDGKKSIAEKIVYSALKIVVNKHKQDNPLNILELALNNVRPLLEVKSRRVGGSTYQVPVEVRPNRKNTLAMRWIIDASRKRSSEKSMILRLSKELSDAIENKGMAVKKRDEMHKMAEANKAFAHYRW